jgi:predicted MFS family arabinose efflux permease
MFFQDVTPNTVGYMIAGYAVFFLVSALYVLSLVIRHRNLKRDLETLEELKSQK